VSINIAVLVSGQGRGSNMQSIVDACASGQIDGEVAVVIGVKEDAPAIERATSAGVETVVIDPKDFGNADDYNEALLDVLKEREIDLICLAGYMRMLGQSIIDTFRNRIMNVHPALIPCFAGKGMFGHHVHEAAIKRGVKISGCTVHFVDENYDEGPIILQTVVPVEDDDTPDDLAARILPEEHKTYARAIALFAEGRLEVVDRRVRVR
jgi:formyltetrahydrofolate-dependent phosphoribosylglycinamide formyltransferase